MGTDLTGRRLLVAGDGRPAAAVAGGASKCGAVVTLAMDARDDGEAATAAHAIGYDGASETDIERALDLALEMSPELDGVIVAIEAAPLPPLEEHVAGAWERCVSQPLRTVFWLVRRGVHELLTAGRGGHIVLVVAGAGGDRRPGSAWMLEGALVSLSRSIAKEYGGRAITCNVVTGGSTPAALRAAVESALFLASPAAGFVTGECLSVAEDSMGWE